MYIVAAIASADMGIPVGRLSNTEKDAWRICFRWQNGHASDVEIADYH
jgi:toxin HigB-1